MKTLKYCLLTMCYKKKFFNSFVFLWGVAIFIVLFQFFGCKDMGEAGSVSTSYFLVANDNFMMSLTLYLTPLLGVYLYGDICLEEQEFMPELLIRTSRWKLNLCNVFLSFISSFLMMLIFLLLVFFFTSFILQTDSTIQYAEIYLWNPSAVKMSSNYIPLSDLFINAPLIRILIYISLFSIYAGLGGLVTYSVSLIVKNKIAVYISSFAFFFIVLMIMSFLGSELYFQNLLNPFPSTYDATTVIRNAYFLLLLYLGVFSTFCIIKTKLVTTLWN